MTQLDIVVLKRIGSRIVATLVVVFGLLLILESLNWPRYLYLAQSGGAELAFVAMAAAAGRWTLRTLTMTVMIGTIIGLLDLQARQELNIIKASGLSIWRVLRAPVLAVILAGIGISLFVESAVTQLDRTLNPTLTNDTGAVTPDGAFWLEQTGEGYRYVIRAGRISAGGTVLDDVTVFLYGDATEYDRIMSPELRYRGDSWAIAEGVGFLVGAPAKRIVDYSLPTTSSPADLRVRMSSTQDLTFFELAGALTTRLSDPILAGAVTTRFMRLLVLPLLLAGSVLIAFAFTAGYRRTNKYGAAVLYGMVLGFVVFFVTEMADRAGSVGALDPTFAAVAPAFVAVVVGLTVLLYREDGRA